MACVSWATSLDSLFEEWLLLDAEISAARSLSCICTPVPPTLLEACAMATPKPDAEKKDVGKETEDSGSEVDLPSHQQMMDMLASTGRRFVICSPTGDISHVGPPPTDPILQHIERRSEEVLRATKKKKNKQQKKKKQNKIKDDEGSQNQKQDETIMDSQVLLDQEQDDTVMDSQVLDRDDEMDSEYMFAGDSQASRG